MPAAAASAATAAWVSGGAMPRLTQWLAATGWANPVLCTVRAMSRRFSIVGSRVSSVCRSTGRAASRAAVKATSMAASGSESRCGQPPTTSTPSSKAALSTARPSAPSAPVIGLPVRATIWRSTSPSNRRRTSCRARTPSTPASRVVFTWERTAVTPQAISSSTAAEALSTRLSSLSRPSAAAAAHASTAPGRSPAGLGISSAVRALSRWAWGSAGAGSSSQPSRSSLSNPSGTGEEAPATAAIIPPSM